MDRARETIIHGSVYDALIADFITIEDVLKYLLLHENDKPTISAIMAYRMICKITKNQIVNGKHFITQTEREEYIIIYYLSYQSTFIDALEESEKLKFMGKYQKKLPKLFSINDFSKFYFIICDLFSDKIYINDDDLLLVIGCRSENYLLKHGDQICKKYEKLLSCDYVSPLYIDAYENYDDLLISRCNYLKIYTPLYWESVAKNLYYELFSYFHNLEDQRIPKNKLEIYSKIFENEYHKRLLEKSDLIYNLESYIKPLQAYLLGFPIDTYMPSDETLKKSIQKLEDEGIENYCEYVSKNNSKYLSDFSDKIFNNDSKIGNEQDTLLENICGYNTFDVIKFYIDNHIYYFTRPEFPNIVNIEKNHWTNQKLPMSILHKAIYKISVSYHYNLPECSTLKEMLIKVENNTLYNQNQNTNPFDKLKKSQLLLHFVPIQNVDNNNNEIREDSSSEQQDYETNLENPEINQIIESENQCHPGVCSCHLIQPDLEGNESSYTDEDISNEDSSSEIE